MKKNKNMKNDDAEEEGGLMKHGMLTEDSLSDFGTCKKAEYFDENGFGVADEANKDKLKAPRPVKALG